MFREWITARAIAKAKAHNAKPTTHKLQRLPEVPCHRCGAYSYSKIKSLIGGISVSNSGSGRWGWHCEECSAITYLETPKEYVDNILQYSHNHWIIVHAKSIPSDMLEHIPTDLLHKHVRRMHNDEVRQQQKELLSLEAFFESTVPEKEKRLRELQQLKDSGKLKELEVWK